MSERIGVVPPNVAAQVEARVRQLADPAVTPHINEPTVINITEEFSLGTARRLDAKVAQVVGGQRGTT